MAQRGKRKCAICKKEIDAAQVKVIGNKAYCPDCITEKEKSAAAYKELTDYLLKLCDGERPILMFLLTQVKRLMNMEGSDYKYSGILATLKYVYDYSENPPTFNPKYGIEYVVINNYYWARKFYEERLKLEAQDKDEILRGLDTPVREVHISQSTLNYQQQLFIDKYKDKVYGPAIDLDSIEDEEDEEDIDEEV